MTGLYRFADMLSTITQVMINFVVVNSLCRKLKVKYTNWILPVLLCGLIYFWTWVIVDGTWKLTAQLILVIALSRLLYKDSIYNIIAAAFMGFIVTCSCESLTLLAAGWFTDSITVNISGMVLVSLSVYIINILINMAVMFLMVYLFRNFRYQLQKKDFLIVGLFELVVFLIINYTVAQFLTAGIFDERVEFFAMLLAMAFVTVFLYMKNAYYLREQEQRDKIQIAQLQQQFTYYQDKLKDEERVRALYHDLKNHLLVLESRQNTEETRQMAESLRSQIAGYENYVHTGNEFLDIILKDKAVKAREKQIDFSAMVDWGGIDFVEPLDISTIFGNAIDNAMEACEKLAEDQRLITVKAECVRDMLLITIENSTLSEAYPTEETTKQDRFLHGFGISNIKNAVEKYGGQCSFRQEDGTYRLKILIPIP